MAVESKPSPPAAISVPKEYPLDFPHGDSEAFDYAASLDKWWTDTRTVLLRQSEIISDLANAIRNQQTGDLTTLNGLISALTLRVNALESGGRGLIVDADVAGDASIREFKLALLYPTHSNENDPTAGEKEALAGTEGTPSDGNRYVTTSDPRLSGLGRGTIRDVLIVHHEEASGVGGGTSNGGSWETRTLNTVVLNTITGASLASDQITLPPGTFDMLVSAPAWGSVAGHQIQMANMTDTDPFDFILGTSEFAGVNQTRSFIHFQFTLSENKVLELQHQTSAVGPVPDGFGSPTGFGTEIYSVVVIRRLR